MHVLLIHQLFATGSEAGGTRHWELASRLAAKGDRVTVVAGTSNYMSGAPVPAASAPIPAASGPKPPPGIAVVRPWMPAFATRLRSSFAARVAGFAAFAASSFFAGLRVRDVDVVWGTTPPIFQAPSAWLLARLKRAPFVLEVRDLWPDFAVALGVLRNRAAVRAAKAMERFLYRRAATVVVNSPGFEDHVRTEGARAVALVANGADPAPFERADRDRRAWRRKLGWEGRFVVLYAGAHGVPNDLEVVLDAATAAGPGNDLFAFAGAGRDSDRLRRLARERGLDNVRFLGPRPKSEVPALLAAADLCVAILKPLPLFATTYPNKVFDYMAAGRPVLLAIDGVARKLVEEAGAGVFVPPGDSAALLKAVRAYGEDPERARREGKAGRAAVTARFHRDAQAERLRTVFRDVLAARRRGGSVDGAKVLVA